MNTLTKSATVIAQIMLRIGATTYREDAYKWASGMMMHIYNDNRMLLCNREYRKKVTNGFCELIEKNGIQRFEYILGTSTAGIAPAAGIAQKLKKNLLINVDGIFYKYRQTLWDVRHSFSVFPTSVVTTTPFAIPHGVELANSLQIGMAYIRKSAKAHGKEQQIEGNLKKGETIVLVTCGESDEAINQIKDTLLEKSITVIRVIDVENQGYQEVSSEILEGSIAIVIEDLFSTGGSAALEVHQLREIGVVCDYCFSIFSYDFQVLRDQFSGKAEIGKTGIRLATPCNIDSILLFDTVYNQLMKENMYTPEIRQRLHEEIKNFDANYAAFLENTSMV